MKTRLLAIFMALLMTVSCLVGCGQPEDEVPAATPSQSDVPSEDAKDIFLGDNWVDTEKAPGINGKTHKKADSIPDSITLIGTDFLPPIGNQGSIGSCSSSSIAYCQFSNAVARYLYSLDPNSSFKPATGKSEYLISSKFTMNFSGAGTAWVYNVLKDHGALTRADTDFYRNQNGAASAGPYNNPYTESASWPVENGDLQKALDIRLTNYEQIWMNTYNYQLTNTERGKELIEKIKDAVVTGNVVVTGGFSSYWCYGTIDDNGLGKLGKKGDGAIVFSMEDGSPGGHQVSIVGYDDNITATVAGVTMKGAFQVANSWGESWQNDGYVWLMYDAVNGVSQYKGLQDNSLYTANRYLSIGKDDVKIGNILGIGTNSTDLTFLKQGTTTVNGKTYNTYFIHSNNTFLTYDGSSVVAGNRPNAQNALWALIPAKDLASMSDYYSGKDNGELLGGYLLYAVNSGSAHFLYGSGSGMYSYTPTLTTISGAYSYDTICFSLPGFKANEKTQTIKATCHNGKGEETPRTFSMDQFCFIYWDQDLEYKQPGYTVTVELSARNREGFYLELTRTDASGKTTSHIPAVFNYGSNFSKVHPNNEYCSEEHYLNFKGEVDGDTCTGYFTLSYASLIDMGASYENYLWGINIYETTSSINVKKITLRDEKGNILRQITPQSNGSGKYMFDFGNELECYRNIGTFYLQNASGEFLNPINYVLLTPGAAEGAQGFEITYDYNTNEYTLKQEDKIYILDIKGDKIEPGVMVKFNSYSPVKNTQTWRIIDNNDGTVTIRLATDTRYAVGLKDGQVCLVTGYDIAKYGTWTLHKGGTNNNVFHLDKEEEKTSIVCTLPDGISGNISVSVCDQTGNTVTDMKPTFDTEGKAVLTTEDLASGIYVFTLMINGKPATDYPSCICQVN